MQHSGSASSQYEAIQDRERRRHRAIDEMGSIEVGKRAHIILANENPLRGERSCMSTALGCGTMDAPAASKSRLMRAALSFLTFAVLAMEST